MRQLTKRRGQRAEPRRNAKPVSLAPLSFDEAIDGLLAVRPEPKRGQPKPAKKPATKKR